MIMRFASSVMSLSVEGGLVSPLSSSWCFPGRKRFYVSHIGGVITGKDSASGQQGNKGV